MSTDLHKTVSDWKSFFASGLGKIIFCGSLGIICLYVLELLSPRMPEIRTPLFTALCVVFVVFCVSIFVFAIAYQSLYRKNSAHFLFNEAITKRQKEVVESETRKDLALLAKKVVLLSELLTEFVEGKATIEPKTYDVLLPSGSRYSFRSGPPIGGAPPTCLFLDVFDENGATILWDGFLPYAEWPREPRDFRDLAHSVIKSFSRRSLELEARLASLPTDSPKVWSILDFLYFSTIIQATVGLGDILPNSTVVRCVVAAQVLIGYIILLVALNMVLSIFH